MKKLRSILVAFALLPIYFFPMITLKAQSKSKVIATFKHNGTVNDDFIDQKLLILNQGKQLLTWHENYQWRETALDLEPRQNRPNHGT